MVVREEEAGHGHGGDSFFASDKSQVLVRGGFDPDPVFIETERIGNVPLHLGNMWHDFGRLGHECAVDVHKLAVMELHLSCRLLEENPARCVLPPRVGIWKESSDVAFAEGAKNRIANSMHQDIRIGVAFEPFEMRNLDSTENQFPSCDQLVHIVSDPDIIHAREYRAAGLERNAEEKAAQPAGNYLNWRRKRFACRTQTRSRLR